MATAAADSSLIGSDGQVPLPHGLLEKMKSSDFKDRLEAISELDDFIHKYPAGLGNNMPKVPPLKQAHNINSIGVLYPGV